jgi:uncharacterized repeat protein (TIGR03803 family)
MKNAPLLPSLPIFRLVLSLFAALALIVIVAQAASAQTETVLYSFCAQSGCPGLPDGGVIADSEGNFYGVTYTGGIGGTVFRFTPAGELSVLDSFDDPHQGVAPGGKLAFDRQGNVYGTAGEGGTNRYLVTAGDGTVFKLSPDGTETDLYNFGADSADGIGPRAVGWLSTPTAICTASPIGVERTAWESFFASVLRASRLYFTLLSTTKPTEATRRPASLWIATATFMGRPSPEATTAGARCSK